MINIRASVPGLKIVDRARKKKRWNKTDLEWQEKADNISRATLSRFLAGKPIRPYHFKAICKAVEVDWEEIVDDDPPPPPPPHDRRQDWGEAPAVSGFCGRTQELATLEQWIEQDRCRLVAISGMGGIGKKYLAATLAQQIQNQFEYLIWRSLQNAPPVEDLLATLLQFLCQQQETDMPATKADRLLQLIGHLREHRCLLILDDWEMVLRGGALAGQYLPGYEGYGELLKLLGESQHKSCLLIATREKPQEITLLAGKDLPVRHLELSGLQEEDALALLSTTCLSSSDNHLLSALIERYGGHPFALKLIPTTIQDLFNGNIAEFIDKSTFVGDILKHLLHQEWERLSALEQDIMYWLAIGRQPVSRSKLQSHIWDSVSESEFLRAMESLIWRSLLEKSPDSSPALFSLQRVVRKYVTQNLISKFCQDIFAFVETQEIAGLGLLRSHALMQSDDEEALKATKQRLLLRPIKEKLGKSEKYLSSQRSLKAQLNEIRVILTEKSPQVVGYAASNVSILLNVTAE